MYILNSLFSMYFAVCFCCTGVVEFLSTGGVDCTHKDFKELRYSDSLTNFNCNGKASSSNSRITHGFKLKSAYENGIMPYTNYTLDFKVKFFQKVGLNFRLSEMPKEIFFQNDDILNVKRIFKKLYHFDCFPGNCDRGGCSNLL